jgi:ubiquinone/menaquinone biosynthesis C-methylase UbiE
MYWRFGPPVLHQPTPSGGFPGSPGTPEKRELTAAINELYDSAMYSKLADEYYDGSGFYNFGYWTETTRNQQEASEKLVDVLLDFIPKKTGKILDVACGTGASTHRLLQHYKPSDIIGINISEKQLSSCRQRVPGVQFLFMDATGLRFPDESIDNILCVEAVFHFDSRESFLHEAYRVLKPGGCLALSDFLLRSRYAAFLINRIPLANFVPTVEEYRSLYERCGFADVRIVEARAQCWEAHRDRQLVFVWGKFVNGEMSWPVLRQFVRRLQLRDWLFSNYLLVSACKPHRYRRDRDERRHRGARQ